MHICLGFKQEKLKMKSVIAFLLVSAMTCYAASAAYMPWPHPPREAATLQQRPLLGAATLQGRNYQGMPVHQQDYQGWRPVQQQDYQGKAYWVIIKMLVKIRSTERLYTAPFNIMYLYRALGTFIGGVIFLEKNIFAECQKRWFHTVQSSIVIPSLNGSIGIYII